MWKRCYYHCSEPVTHKFQFLPNRFEGPDTIWFCNQETFVLRTYREPKIKISMDMQISVERGPNTLGTTPCSRHENQVVSLVLREVRSACKPTSATINYLPPKVDAVPYTWASLARARGKCSRFPRGSHMLSCNYIRHHLVTNRCRVFLAIYPIPRMEASSWSRSHSPFRDVTKECPQRMCCIASGLKKRISGSSHEATHWASNDGVNSQSRTYSYLVTAKSAGSMPKAERLIPPPNCFLV